MQPIIQLGKATSIEGTGSRTSHVVLHARPRSAESKELGQAGSRCTLRDVRYNCRPGKRGSASLETLSTLSPVQ